MGWTLSCTYVSTWVESMTNWKKNLGTRFSNLLCDRLIKKLKRENSHTENSEADFSMWISLLIVAFYRFCSFQSISKSLWPPLILITTFQFRQDKWHDSILHRWRNQCSASPSDLPGTPWQRGGRCMTATQVLKSRVPFPHEDRKLPSNKEVFYNRDLCHAPLPLAFF